MPPNQQQLNTDEMSVILEHILVNDDKNAKDTHTLLENIIEINAKSSERNETLLENNIEMQSKVITSLEQIKEVLNKPEAPEKEVDLSPVISAISNLGDTINSSMEKFNEKVSEPIEITLEIT